MRWLHLSSLHYSPAGQNYDTRMLEKLRESIVDIVRTNGAVDRRKKLTNTEYYTVVDPALSLLIIE